MQTRRVTIKDIASRVGVSATVVSQVLRGVEGSMVSHATRERILETAQELGYRPNRLARALVSGKTQTIAIWRHGVYTAFHAWVMHQCALRAYEDGYEVIIRDFTSVRENSVWIHLSDVDGVLAHECVAHVRMLLEHYPGILPPVVSMGVYVVPECDHVTVDLYPAARASVEHLIQQGCRRIAFVADEPAQSVGEPRYEAYRAVLEEAGLPQEFLALHDASRPQARRILCEYFQTRGAPEGIFCHNDDTAIVCLRALHDLGIRVPDDAAVIGCDGIVESEYTVPELSTIVQPIEQMCRHGWMLLKQRMEHPTRPRQEVVLQARFVPRGSSQRS